MSMNLHVIVDGVDVDLYQTPTHITRMCLMNYKPESIMTGGDARRAVRLYTEWVSSLKNGVFPDAVAAKEWKDSIEAHVSDVLEIVESGAVIEAYSL